VSLWYACYALIDGNTYWIMCIHDQTLWLCGWLAYT
jgi:hypothetical protein